MSQSVRAHLVLICVVAVWGSTFVLLKAALHDVSPLLFNLVRMILAFAFLAFIYRRQWPRITRTGWKSGAVLGVILAAAYQLQTAGLARTTPSKSAFITALSLVFVPLLSAVPGLRNPGSAAPSRGLWLGVLLAFLGVILLTMPAPAGGNFFVLERQGSGLGDLLTLGCALAFAGHIVYQDRVSAKPAGSGETTETVAFEQLALLQIGFCALAMAFSSPILEKPHLHITRLLLITLVVEAVFATAIAFTAQSWVQQFLAPTYLVLIYAMEPFFAWLTSLVFLHQGLNARAGSGAALILAGVLTAEWTKRASPSNSRAENFV